MPVRRVVVAGAGIGGLTLAAALLRRGVDVVVLERVPEVRPVGAGIVLAVNATRALERVGLAEAIRAAGSELRQSEIRDRDGQVIQSVRLSEVFADTSLPTLAFHRAELHDALLAAAGDTVRLGCEVTEVGESQGRAFARLKGGTVEEGDLVVGADGLHSKVREALVGETPLVYSGQTSWRGITPPVDLVAEGTSIESWGPGRRFGMVALSGRRVYWFAVADAPAGGVDQAEALGAELQRAYEGWHAPIRRVLDATPVEAILRTDIHDRDPVPSWSRGRLTLLGDAAHPMTPNLGQGACQAVEDAVALADALEGAPSIEEALRAYEARRVPRTRRFVLESRRFGSVSHWRHPLTRWARNSLLRAIPPRVVAARFREMLDGGVGIP